MVYLAVLALAGAMALSDAAGQWSRAAGHTLTVQLPHDSDRVAAALGLLRKTPGIASAEPLADSDIAALLAPWLGRGAAAADLPYPRVIDVRLESGGRLDSARLAARLAELVPGASLDDHKLWLDRLVGVARMVQWTAAAIMLLIAAAAVATAAFATRMAFATHREAIETMHLIGAPDSYIAAEFQTRAALLGLKGGIIGFTGALVTGIAIGRVGLRVDSGLFAEIGFGPAQWVVLAILPGAAALVAMVTARITVLRALARMG